MVELVDTADLKSVALGRVGSSPTSRTIFLKKRGVGKLESQRTQRTRTCPRGLYTILGLCRFDSYRPDQNLIALMVV